jgi:hypothetical protein
VNAHKRLLFLLEIETQARFALRAARDLKRAVNRALFHHGKTESIWYATQAFLVASANVSKLLWGSSERSSTERRPIRELLGVEDDSPLRSRSLRNHFEHIDERIDRWIDRTADELATSVDLHLGSAEHAVPDELFRGFDPKREEFLWADERYELEPLIHSLRALHAATRLALPPVWAPKGRESETE